MEVISLHYTLLVLGALLLVGLVMDEIGRRTRLPRVTLLILFGVIIGPSVLDLLPEGFQAWYGFLATTALTMVAFLLGGKLSLPTLRRHGKKILIISVTVVSVTTLIVSGGLMAVGTPVLLALLLAGIATSTAPAATQDVVKQTRAKGPFTDTLLSIVAVDDAWGLFVFSLLLIVANALVGDGLIQSSLHCLRELVGAIAIGLALGLPAAFFTGRIRPGEPTQIEALGLVFLCAGLAVWLEVSFLIAGMVAGALVVNLAKHHNRPFREIEHIEWPFMVLFFILAGASVHIGSIGGIGVVGVAYLVLRAISRIVGGWLGSVWADAPVLHKRWIGLALTPQAGVALGMALVASSHFPEMKEALLAVTIGTTVIFELTGPLLTQLALRKAGEVGQVVR